MKIQLLIYAITLAFVIVPCTSNSQKTKQQMQLAEKELSFESSQIVDSARYWWAVTIGEITGDGLADIVFIDSNNSGGYLAYKKGKKESGLWEETIIAREPPTGGTFASGDLESGDMDGDFDVFRLPGHEAREYFILENKLNE